MKFLRGMKKSNKESKRVLSVFLILVLVGALLGLSSCKEEAKSEKKDVLYISAIPDQKQEELNLSMKELSKVLSEETGLDVQYKEVTDYNAVVQGFQRDEIQLAWFGGLTGIQGRDLVEGSNAIVQRQEDAHFKSVFIANNKSNIKSLSDLKGKSFTFGSESSTSGHLMPRYFLKEEGIIPENDFKGTVGYSGSHDKTIELVSNGTYDSGAVNISVWDRFVKEGLVDTSKVTAFYTTPEYYDYNFSIQNKKDIDSKYGEGAYDKIQKALLNIDPAANKDLNVFFNTKGFIETKNENYNEIESIAKDLGLIK